MHSEKKRNGAPEADLSQAVFSCRYDHHSHRDVRQVVDILLQLLLGEMLMLGERQELLTDSAGVLLQTFRKLPLLTLDQQFGQLLRLVHQYTDAHLLEAVEQQLFSPDELFPGPCALHYPLLGIQT